MSYNTLKLYHFNINMVLYISCSKYYAIWPCAAFYD